MRPKTIETKRWQPRLGQIRNDQRPKTRCKRLRRMLGNRWIHSSRAKTEAAKVMKTTKPYSTSIRQCCWPVVVPECLLRIFRGHDLYLNPSLELGPHEHQPQSLVRSCSGRSLVGSRTACPERAGLLVDRPPCRAGEANCDRKCAGCAMPVHVGWCADHLRHRLEGRRPPLSSGTRSTTVSILHHFLRRPATLNNCKDSHNEIWLPSGVLQRD